MGVGAAVSEGVSGGEAAEHLRIVGGGGGCDVARGAGRRGRRAGYGVGSDREADQQRAGVRAGSKSECGASGSAWGDLCWWGWPGAGVLAAAGDDWGAVCAESDCAGALREAVPDGGSGAGKKDQAEHRPLPS